MKYIARFRSYAVHQKTDNIKMTKVTKGQNSGSIFLEFIKKLIRSSTHQYQSIHEVSRL